MWQDGEVNGLGRLRVSASSREEHAWTKPQGRRGGVLAVYGEGALKGTHTHPYPRPGRAAVRVRLRAGVERF